RCSRRCCSRRLAHRGRPVTTRPTPPVTGPPPRPPPLPPPGPPPLPPPPPVVQVTIRGSQMKVGQGLGLSPWPPPRPPFRPPWSCFLCSLSALRRFGGTWFQVWPVNTGVGNGSTPSGEKMFSAEGGQIAGGQVPPMPPEDSPPSSPSVWLALPSLLPCSLVNSATASVWLGMAPMKNADWALSVVPVLAMISWPLLMAAPGAVAYGASSFDI